MSVEITFFSNDTEPKQFKKKKKGASCTIALGFLIIIQRSNISTLGFQSSFNDEIMFFGCV